jgi:hypothetical protein
MATHYDNLQITSTRTARSASAGRAATQRSHDPLRRSATDHLRSPRGTAADTIEQFVVAAIA